MTARSTQDGERSSDDDEGRLPQTRKRVSVASACNLCRTKKSKCSGERPTCAACRKNSVVCVYQTSSADETHQKASKRRLVELQEKADAQDQLLEKIKTSSDVGAIALFNQLRTGEVLQRSACWVQSMLTASPTSVDGDSTSGGEAGATAVLGVLASSADDESSMILARLRLGEPWERIASSILATARLNNPDASSDQSQTADSPVSHSALSAKRPALRHELSMDDPSEAVPSQAASVFNCDIWKKASRRRRRDKLHVEAQLRSSRRSNVVSFAPYIGTSIGHQNVLLPVWAMRTLNEPLGQTPDPFERVSEELKGYLHSGVAVETLCGPHAFIGAVDDETIYARAPKLSQIVANIVNSVKANEAETSVTKCALMWLYWVLWRWTLMPTPSTYSDVPVFMRPTPYQLFAYHARVFDFVVSPTLRDYMCQIQDPDCAWLSEAYVTLQCDWPHSAFEALCRDASTGEMDLSVVCKAYASAPESWSFGSSVRPLLSNADRYIKIR